MYDQGEPGEQLPPSWIYYGVAVVLIVLIAVYGSLTIF